MHPLPLMRQSLVRQRRLLKLATFNVLSPSYALPAYYPKDAVPFLSREFRLNRIMDLLRCLRETCDVIALQEVTFDQTTTLPPDSTAKLHPDRWIGDLNHFRRVLGTSFHGVFYPHERQYWREWTQATPEDPSRNMRNGNALFFNRDKFGTIGWKDMSLSSGNHVVEGHAKHKDSGCLLRVLSVHLDSDRNERREREYKEALTNLPYQSGTIDVVMGDFNSGVVVPPIREIMMAHKFEDALIETQSEVEQINNSVDVSIDTLTFALTDNDRLQHPIDHITYRSNLAGPTSIIPSGDQGTPEHTITGVLHHNLWDLYPPDSGCDTQRLISCLKLFGSDHMPVVATLEID